MGPIGSFFSRLASHLEKQGVPVWKVSLPLHEFGFPSERRLRFQGPMEDFAAFLQAQIETKGIRHLFMYGDFIDPHRIAIDLIQKLNQDEQRLHKIDAWVFELGYVRPNFVSLEKERVNARSSLNKGADFYQQLPSAPPLARRAFKPGIRWRKWWKMPTFILHSFTNYRIIQGSHKLQPRPSYLWAQTLGLVRKYIYSFSERSILSSINKGGPYILVPLQVSNDSQITLSSDYQGMEPFIEELIDSFATDAEPGDRLVFKHHPRDRGYNHYGRLIRRLAQAHGIAHRVLYFHDGPLGPILKRAKAVVTINSTVGLQALYHATPTKVLGRTFYNMPGLTDQQSLADFWRHPEPSDRDLFLKFYAHLIETTQISGNFDGAFPFASTFRIAPGLAPRPSSRRPTPLRVALRLLILISGFATYYLQLLAIALGARDTARRLLEKASRLVLQGLGVRVLMHRRQGPPDLRPEIHIANHGHPLDVLLVQGHFRECSMTTAARHLRHLLPLFRLSAENYGHIHLNHLCPGSRFEGLRKLIRLMRSRGRLFLFPSGSLVTPITDRVSGSLHLLARHSDALIIPWTTHYEGFAETEEALRYRPLPLILSRLTGPEATIRCHEGTPIEPRQFADQRTLSRHIREYYRSKKQAKFLAC
jgi:capsular polysaccharide export protein